MRLLRVPKGLLIPGKALAYKIYGACAGEIFELQIPGKASAYKILTIQIL